MSKILERRRPRDAYGLAKVITDIATRRVPNDEAKKPFRIKLKKNK